MPQDPVEKNEYDHKVIYEDLYYRIKTLKTQLKNTHLSLADKVDSNTSPTIGVVTGLEVSEHAITQSIRTLNLDTFGKVDGVKLADGTSCSLTDKIVTVPYASKSAYGVVKIGNNINVTNGAVSVTFPSASNGLKLDAGTYKHDVSVTGVTEPSSSNPATSSLAFGGTVNLVNSITRDSYGHVTSYDIQKYSLPTETPVSIGTSTSASNPTTVITGLTVDTQNNHKLIPSTVNINTFGKVDDVKIGSTSLVSNKIASIPTATKGSLGLVTIGDNSNITIDANGVLTASKQVDISYSDSVPTSSFGKEGDMVIVGGVAIDALLSADDSADSIPMVTHSTSAPSNPQAGDVWYAYE